MATSETLIITISDIQEYSPISSRVDNSIIEPAQRRAHVILEKILGRTLYAQIQTAIDLDSTLSGEADLKTLVDYYIKPYVAWLTWFNSIYPIHFQASKTGIQTKSDNGYEAVSLESLKELKNDASAQVDELGTQLYEHLYKNKATYTNFATTTTEEFRSKPPVSIGGVYLPKRAKLYYDDGFPDAHRIDNSDIQDA